MNAVDIALAKQRLQLDAAHQREVLGRHARGLQPAFDTADQIRTGFFWLKRHPEALAASVALLAAAGPKPRRFLWRWGQRGFIAWKLWRNSERWLTRPSQPAR